MLYFEELFSKSDKGVGYTYKTILILSTKNSKIAKILRIYSSSENIKI